MSVRRDTSGDEMAAALDELDRRAAPAPVMLTADQRTALADAMTELAEVMGHRGICSNGSLVQRLACARTDLRREAALLSRPVDGLMLSSPEVKLLRAAITGALQAVGRLADTRDFRLAGALRAAKDKVLRAGSCLSPAVSHPGGS